MLDSRVGRRTSRRENQTPGMRHDCYISENAPELWNVPGELRSHLELANQVGGNQVGRKEDAGTL